MYQSLKNLDKFSQAILREDEYGMLILRTHLLIEEKLRDFLSMAFVRPNTVVKANLSFSQVMRLSEGLCNRDDLKWFWDSVILLNKMRNELAHEIGADLREVNMSNLLNIINKQGMSHLGPDDVNMLHPVKGRLAFLYSQACSLADDDFGFLKHKSE